MGSIYGETAGLEDLVGLVTDPQIQSVYQERAIEILLCPDVDKLPFKANTDTPRETLVDVIPSEWIGKVTEAQASFIGAKISEYIDEAKENLKKNPANYTSKNALITYNDLIPGLLKELPQKEAELLFAKFDINDPFPYANTETSSRYNPLRRLYYDSEVNESWKRIAAEKMHKIILDEHSGKANPREEHEAAAKAYADVLGIMLYSENLRISNEFYRDEIVFMLGIDTGEKIVDQWHTTSVLNLLPDEETRHQFARRQILANKDEEFGRFSVYNLESEATAIKIKNEFSADQELVSYLEEELQKWEEDSGRMEAEQDERQKKEEEIASKMRKPLM